MPTGHVAAVLFDLDGLLVDSERVAVRAGARALASLGFPDCERLLTDLIGLDELTGYTALQDRLGKGLDPEILAAAWMAEKARIIESEGVPAMPGARFLLSTLADRGLPFAVVTSSRRESAERKLRRVDLLRLIPGIVSVDDVSRPKPDPEPYLRGADLVGADPSACIVFEDSVTGASAAHAAGSRVVQVRGVNPARFGHATHFAETLLDGARAVGLLSEADLAAT